MASTVATSRVPKALLSVVQFFFIFSCLSFLYLVHIMRFVYLAPFLGAVSANTILLTDRAAQSWNYQGCYLDNTSQRTLTHSSGQDYNDQTIETCTSYCQANGFNYAGLEYGSVHNLKVRPHNLIISTAKNVGVTTSYLERRKSLTQIALCPVLATRLRSAATAID